VLLVEDDPLVAMMLAELLRELDFEVIGTAATVEAALETLNGNAVDVAVLDVQLGYSNSGAIAEACRLRGIPFVFVTGYPPGQFEHTGVPLLSKPFSPEDLRRALESVLSVPDGSPPGP
jgi:CheY-like chemotaxis protein